jgi:hypothetical protein
MNTKKPDGSRFDGSKKGTIVICSAELCTILRGRDNVV